ncbi:hypothetical protein Lal_00038505 [Lupinus albus]|nr:hypothetical protein Lal_00038505 [Lupinus albus]
MTNKEDTRNEIEVINPNPSIDTNPPINTNQNPPTETLEKNEASKDEGGLKKKSIVWDHFTKLPFTDTKGQHKVKCNHCRSTYFCDPNKHGTNSMRKKLARKHQWIFSKVGKHGTIHGFMTKNVESDVLDGMSSMGYNLEDCRRVVNEFIICNEMSFKVVEGCGFRRMINQLEPRFIVPSRFTIARDCYQLFLEEKKKLKAWFSKSCKRICMTTDCWTSNQNLGYILEATKKNLELLPSENHKGETIGKEMERCLREWGIERVFTITVDNEQQPSIDNIRNVVRYVRSSPSRLKIFKECIEDELIESQSLVCLDVPTRWNSTYLMLEHSEKFEKTFDRLYDQESDFRKWFGEDDKRKRKGGPPTEKDWHQARIFIQFLEIFYRMTLCFSGSLHMTSNKCYSEIASIQAILTSRSCNQSELLGSMALSMIAKYDKYWGNVEKINPLLFVGNVLDPRFKLEYDTCSENLAVNMLTLVKDTLEDFYNFYAQGISDNRERIYLGDSTSNVLNTLEDDNVKGSKIQDVVQNREKAWKKQKRAKHNYGKCDLERYLAENTLEDEDDFDILAWWKTNSSKYKILSIMARDVFVIPVSTVASESCFSTSGRVIDVFRSSLSPKMVEALICTQNWLNPASLKFYDKDFDQFDSIEKIIGVNVRGSLQPTRLALQRRNKDRHAQYVLSSFACPSGQPRPV